MSDLSSNRQPLLNTEPTDKNKAIYAAGQLIVQLQTAERYYIPTGKYAAGILAIFKIPLLQGENSVLVAIKKLNEWRIIVNRQEVTELGEITAELERFIGILRQAIASKISSREQRRKSNTHRKYRVKPQPFSDLYKSEVWGGDPYAD